MTDTFDIVMPLELEGTTATVRSWLKQIGDKVRRDEPLVELETDKVTTEVPAPTDGVLAEIILESDTPAGAGALLGRLATETSGAVAPSDEMPMVGRPLQAPPEGGTEAARIRLSPAVRRAVAEHGVDPAKVPATGRNGRLTRADVERFVEQRLSAPRDDQPERLVATAPERFVEPPAASLPVSRTLPVDRMRRTIAENMVASVAAAPHVTAVFEADFSAIMTHRAKNRAAFEARGVSLTYTAYLVAACVAAMRVMPVINSRWHEDAIEIFEATNVGIGTALGDKGLVVPVVHNAQNLSLAGIANRLQDITARARDGTLKAADMKNATFTISNHGVSGSLVAAPIIIPQPQTAILGVGKLQKRVVVREIDGNDTIQIRPISYVSLTIDHRVVDGHQTNVWLSAFVSTLEAWPPHEP